MKILVVLLPRVGIPSITGVKTPSSSGVFAGCWATWLPEDLRLCAPCDASGLAKGVPACGHTHTCTAHASLFPSHAFFPMLVARFTWSGLTSAHLYSVDTSPCPTPFTYYVSLASSPGVSPVEPTLGTSGLQRQFS